MDSILAGVVSFVGVLGGAFFLFKIFGKGQ